MSLNIRTCMFLSFSLFFLCLAVSQFIVIERFYDVIYAARLIENGKTVNAKYIDTLLDTMLEDAPLCRSDALKAVTTNVLFNLDGIDRTRETDRWNRRLAAATRFLRQAIACQPTDGNLWLRLAMLRWGSNTAAWEVVILLQRSQQFAPFETDVLLGRLRMWNRLPQAALTAGRQAAAADVAAYRTYFKTSKSAAMAKPGPALAALIEEMQL